MLLDNEFYSKIVDDWYAYNGECGITPQDYIFSAS